MMHIDRVKTREREEPRMTRKHRLLVACLAVLLLVLAVGCGGDDEESAPQGGGETTAEEGSDLSLNQSGTLIVGMNLQYKPQMFLEGGEPAGYDVDLLNALAEELGVELQIENLDFNGLIPGLVSKQFDMVSVGLAATEERKKSVDFTRGYVPYAQILGARKDDDTPATTEAWDDSSKTITSLQGSTAEMRVQESFPSAQSKSFPDQNAAFLEVSTGRADGIVVENYLLAQFNNSNNDALKEVEFEEPLHVEYGSWAVQKGNTALVERLDEFICEMQDSGELAELYEKWHETPMPPMPDC
jgi:ABC-type amino acid transport substrate-binding protein